MKNIKATIIFSDAYNEYRVKVGKSTYYTSDEKDAIATARAMLAEAGGLDHVMKSKAATTDQEDNW